MVSAYIQRRIAHLKSMSEHPIMEGADNDFVFCFTCKTIETVTFQDVILDEVKDW